VSESPPRAVKRRSFSSLARIQLLEDDADTVERHLASIQGTLRWILRTLVGLLLAIIATYAGHR
jgi:hypothetical protein